MSNPSSYELSYVRMADAVPDAGTDDPLRLKHFSTADNLSTQRNGLNAWISTLWPLILHCISALAIACFMVFYVNDNRFNLTERTPSMVLGDRTIVQSGRFAPLQSDITTLLSIFLSVFRWLLATWASALCWYCLFLLMGRAGLSHRDLQWMASYKVFPFSTYFRDPLTFFIGYVLLVTTFMQFAAPMMTGSITWIPSTLPAELVSRASVEVSVASPSAEWHSYATTAFWRERVAVQAAGLATIAWGRGLEKGTLKRVLPSTDSLNINSTLANVTLPYFSVTSLEWISNPEDTLSPDQLTILGQDGVDSRLSTRPDTEALSMPGTLALIPEGNWTTDWVDRPFPPPSAVSQTRILVIYGSYQLNNTNCSDTSRMFSQPPPPVRAYQQGRRCYAFARVTYRAGAGMCKDCRLSSNSTVQNDTAIVLHAHPMTVEALRLMPDVTNNLVLMNASIPSHWDVFDDYVTEVLVRSYSVSWTALVGRTGEWSPKLTTRITATIPASRAVVNIARVYTWLIMQLFVTFFSLFFLGIQSRSRYVLLGDTSMVPFYVDTTDLTRPSASGKVEAKENLRVEPVGNHWKIVTSTHSF